MLHVRLEEMYRWAAFVADRDRVDELHAMRIAAKRLRYTMEIFAPAFEGVADEFDTLYNQVKSVQEQIGEVHDADVRIPMVQQFLDKEGAAHPEERVGLEALVRRQESERAKRYQNFVAFWAEMQQQGFKRKFLQMLAGAGSGRRDDEQKGSAPE